MRHTSSTSGRSRRRGLLGGHRPAPFFKALVLETGVTTGTCAVGCLLGPAVFLVEPRLAQGRLSYPDLALVWAQWRCGGGDLGCRSSEQAFWSAFFQRTPALCWPLGLRFSGALRRLLGAALGSAMSLAAVAGLCLLDCLSLFLACWASSLGRPL